MSSASVRNNVVWIILSLAGQSCSFGMLLVLAVQNAMQHDSTLQWIWPLVLLPLFVLGIVVNTRHILSAIP